MAERFQLQRELQRYVQNGPYPMHMPGHKRRLSPAPTLPFQWDLTEVPGVDDLHEAEGILREAMERTAQLHGAARTWYLVGGSTCGLLAGIRALAPAGSRVIVARNCHKSVYHAIELGGLQARWLLPPIDGAAGVYGSIPPAAVKEALEECPDAAAVVLTSPTYEGVLSDIAFIAEICHERKVPLMVDEAHGAHLGLFPGWPDSALHLGADIVVQSAHKTLPSLTQTALLHLGQGSLADPEEVERQLDVFETSSPSYPLMASLDGCTGILREEGKNLMESWREQLLRFDQKILSLRHLKVLCHGSDSLADHPYFFGIDPGKLPICTAGTGITGTELARRLREEYAMELEMACGHTALAMTSLSDDPEALMCLAEALISIDQTLYSCKVVPPVTLPVPGDLEDTIAKAIVMPAEDCPMDLAEDRISGEYVWAYPPGVPLVAPGERITAEFLDSVRALTEMGTGLHHSHCKEEGWFRVLR